MSDQYPPPPRQPPGPPTGPPPGGPSANEAKGLFAALYDFSFTTFVTPKIVRIAYLLATVLIGIGALVFFVSMLATGEGAAILVALVVVPLAALVYLVLVRMTLEFYVALIRMSEDIHHRLPPAP